MQCNWSSRANLFLRHTVFRQSTSPLICRRTQLAHTLSLASRPGPIPADKLSTPSRIISPYHALLASRLQISSSFYSSSSTVSSNAQDGLPPPPPIPTFSSSPPSSSLASPAEPTVESLASEPPQPSPQSTGTLMTSARMSRVSAHTVRLSVRSGAVMDAVFILNSLYRSIEEKPGQLAPLEDIGPMQEGFTEIAYGKAVSPRLSNHAFLHAMIRAGHAGRAARLAELMMARGTRMQSRTLEALIQALCANPQDKFRARALHLASIAREGPRPPMLEMNAELVQDPSIRAAVRILQSARDYSQRRTEHMYATIVKFCILQGEILFGCLLFVMLIKDWQARQAFVAEESAVLANPEEPPSAEKLTRLYKLRRFDNNTMQPKMSTMGTVLESIEGAFEKPPQDREESDMFQQALQALAMLASMVEQGFTPFSKLSPLIRVLMSCPNVDQKVWISQDGIPTEVKAYDYFHEVLIRIILSLKESDQPPLKLPPLDRTTYNSLLHYALRHRLSPALANVVLEHMTVKRRKPLKPDAVTHNILMRSATLLRNSDIASAVIDRFKQEGRNQAIFRDVETRLPTNEEAVPYRMRIITRAFPSSVETSSLEERMDSYKDLAKLIRSFDTKPTATVHTVTTYITHLTSIGKPHLVADVLFDILPELRIVDHPSSSAEAKERKKRTREACLRRVARFGPQFFGAILNALAKAGRTSLAERVWLLAVQAQRASWVPDFVPGTRPWCLSIHAYTSMLQCYAKEARKPMPQIQPGPEDAPDWTPKDNRYVRGWARIVLMRRQVTNLPRRIAGREMGALVFQSLSSGGEDVFASARHLLAHGKEVGIPSEALPVPDARFFNAALALFGRDPALTQHKRPTTLRRRLRFSLSIYSRFGAMHPVQNPILQEVVEALVEHGYSIPPAYRHMFVGRLPVSSLQDVESPDFDRTPLAYRPVSQLPYRANRIPVAKTKGLPIRKHGKRTRKRTNVN
ncbi:hypothetical protein QCA50_005909 [Cerrena zonata]|uniref:Uncharacterized protein n=1 Tax=Cerrena zonata TaxID=2478898 RepID=A0AAW0GGG7_9APHY